MFDFSDYNLPLNTGPASAPPNPQPSTSNPFAFPGYLESSTLSLYNQLHQQFNTPSYVSIPSPATINNLSNSFQQQHFNSPTGFPSAATTPMQSSGPNQFFQQQPTTSFQSNVYSAVNNPPNAFQNWTQNHQWSSSFPSSSSALLYNPDVYNVAACLNQNQTQLSRVSSNTPLTPTDDGLWIPKTELPKSEYIILFFQLFCFYQLYSHFSCCPSTKAEYVHSSMEREDL